MTFFCSLLFCIYIHLDFWVKKKSLPKNIIVTNLKHISSFFLEFWRSGMAATDYTSYDY